MRRVLTASFVVPLLVLAVAAGVRLWALGLPDRLVGDEVYYIHDARAYLVRLPPMDPSPDDPVHIDDEMSWMHPPMGKLLIAAGIALTGNIPVGWRVASALFGIAAVWLVYQIGLSLWRSPWWAGLAGLLLALDGLSIVQSRAGMLDVFVPTFILGAAYCLIRNQLDAPPLEVGWVERLFGSRWILGAGLCLGGAVATKWSGFYALGPAFLISVVIAVRSAPTGWRERARAVLRIALGLIVVPAVVYLASYTELFVQHGPDPRTFIALQAAMVRFHAGLEVDHPQASRAQTWPVLAHPFMWYRLPDRDSPGPGWDAEVLGVGNPALWWGWLALLPVLLWSVVWRRDIVGALILGAYLFMWVPWLFVPRTEYMYYMLPAVPFMALGSCAALRALPGRWGTRVAVGLSTLTVVVAVAFMPMWLGLVVPASWLTDVHWLPGWI